MPPPTKTRAKTREVLTSSKGRCLVAATAVQPGTEVLRCTAEAWALLPSDRDTRCAHCLQQPLHNKPPSRCAQCKRLRFCSVVCQKAAWPAHRAECEALGRVAPKIPGPTLLMAARLIRQILQEGFDGPLYQGIERLVHHEGAAPPPKQQLMQEMASLVCTLVFPPPLSAPATARTLHDLGGVAWVARLLFRLSCNGFSITDDESRPLGTGLFLGAVAANHSCAPNCYQLFEGPVLRLRALRPIAAGEELTIGYVDLGKPRAVRQQELWAGYGFACTCSRCASVAEAARETRILGWACPRAGCAGACVEDGKEEALYQAWRRGADESALDAATQAPRARRCEACGAGWTETQVVARMADLAMAENYFEQGKATMEGKEKAALGDAVGLLEKALDIYTRLLVPKISYQAYEVASLLVHACVGLHDWGRALHYGELSVVGAEACTPLDSPMPATEHALLGKLAWQMDDPAAAATHLRAALRKLVVSHGEGNGLVREVSGLLNEVQHEAQRRQQRRNGGE